MPPADPVARPVHTPEGPPPDDHASPFPEREFALHVFTVGAAQVGVCFTGIGIVRLVSVQGTISRLADDLLAFDALGFLLASLVAYLGLRSRSRRHRVRLERAADALLLLALLLQVTVGLLLAYELL